MTDALSRPRLYTYENALLGARVRYLNLPLLFLFLSPMPMPVPKLLCATIAGLALACNVAYHAFLLRTRRHEAASYAMLGVDLSSIGVSVYYTGLQASPFLMLIPLYIFSVYFTDWDKRATLRAGFLLMALYLAAFAAWWWSGRAATAWNPRDYPAFAVLVCVIHVLAFAGYLHGTLEANPIVEELGRQQAGLADQQHKAELGASLSIITHEVRNPLTSINLGMELITQAAEGAPAAPRAKVLRQVAMVEEELARVSRMLDGVLSYARERRGRYVFAAMEARDLFDRATDFIRLKYGRHDRSLRFEPGPRGPCPVWGDADALYQVLVNLLDNAVQAREPGRPLRLELGAVPDADGGAVLTVRDNGRGIPADRLPHIFERFFTQRDGGTGLGLFIARQIVTDHGGAIEVQSAAGVGTTFTLRLRSQPPAPAPEAPA